MHPYSSLQSRVSVSKTEGAVPGGGKNSTMDKRIEINGKCLQIVEIDLAVVCSPKMGHSSQSQCLSHEPSFSLVEGSPLGSSSYS